jgi:tetratricopeptide (TPR) repeat protein
MMKKTAVKRASPARVSAPVSAKATAVSRPDGGVRAKAAPTGKPVAEGPSPAKQQLTVYEQAVGLFSQRRLKDALAGFLRAAAGPDSHVADKARSYAQVCERRTRNMEPQLQTAEDHFNYGVERLNERDFERAMQHFERALALQPGAEHVYFTMALCCGLTGDGTGACENLKRAIELEPRNRIMARQDPEFAALLPQFPGLRALLTESAVRV